MICECCEAGGCLSPIRVLTIGAPNVQRSPNGYLYEPARTEVIRACTFRMNVSCSGFLHVRSNMGPLNSVEICVAQ